MSGDGFEAGMFGFAEALGEALGRGVARGLNVGLGGPGHPQASAAAAGRRAGRPAKNVLVLSGAQEKQCAAEGCTSAARAKGLCSRHYQAERRKQNASA